MASRRAPDCWEVPRDQKPWDVRTFFFKLLVRWDDLLISNGAILRNPQLLDAFLGGSSWIINCISPRMKYSTWISGFGGPWILTPRSPVSSPRPRLASLFWASRNCWRAFALGTSSWKTCRVLMVMQIWKNMLLLNGWTDNLRVQKKQRALMFRRKYKALGNFGVAAIQNDAATNHHHWWYPNWATNPLPRLQVLLCHAWALDGRGTKESKDAWWFFDLSHLNGRLWPKYPNKRTLFGLHLPSAILHQKLSINWVLRPFSFAFCNACVESKVLWPSLSKVGGTNKLPEPIRIRKIHV